MGFVTTADGTEIFYKDWGSGTPVVFSHGWPLNSDIWDDQLNLLAENGYRAIAHDRRGHGRSGQPWQGNDMDTYADDLGALIEALDLRDAVLVGHSTGGGEVTHYIGRHGTGRVAKAVLVSAVPPLLVKTDANPDGMPIELFDEIRAGLRAERSQYWRETAVPFFGANRSGSKATQGNQDEFWLQAMQLNLKGSIDCVKAFSEVDMTEDLKRFGDVPALLIHGDDDQIVPIDLAAKKAVKLIPNATLKIYEGAPHGLTVVPGFKERFNQDLLDFLKS